LITRQAAARALPVSAEEDDDYEPEYQPMDVGDNGTSTADAISAAIPEFEPELVSLGPFVLPKPPPLTEEEAADLGRSAAERAFAMYTSMPTPQKSAKGSNQQQLGFSRLAGSNFDRDAWGLLVTRLATRASNGLDSESSAGKNESGFSVKKKPMISDAIREMLYRHILEDFRSRINIGITWLNEEWYNDAMQMRYAAIHRGEEEDISVPLHYDHWVQRLLDGILPYLDARDKILIRFLSEIPEMTIPIVARVKGLARDPERVNLCVQALLSVPPLLFLTT
jgi:symplekin